MSHDPKYLNTIKRNTKSIIQIRIRLQIVKIYDIINTYDTINVYDNNNNTTYFYKRIASSRFVIRQPANKFMKTENTLLYSNFQTTKKYFSFPIISRIHQIHNYKIYIHEKFILVRNNIIALLTLLQNFEMTHIY